MDESLKAHREPLFILDGNFDFLADSKHVHILMPKGFEGICEIEKQLFEQVPDSIKKIQHQLPFIDWNNIENLSLSRKTFARQLYSISQYDQIATIDELKESCESAGINLKQVGNLFQVDNKQVKAFLSLLDRRIYEVRLVKETSERFQARVRNARLT